MPRRKKLRRNYGEAIARTTNVPVFQRLNPETTIAEFCVFKNQSKNEFKIRRTRYGYKSGILFETFDTEEEAVIATLSEILSDITNGNSLTLNWNHGRKPGNIEKGTSKDDIVINIIDKNNDRYVMKMEPRVRRDRNNYLHDEFIVKIDDGMTVIEDIQAVDNIIAWIIENIKKGDYLSFVWREENY